MSRSGIIGCPTGMLSAKQEGYISTVGIEPTTYQPTQGGHYQWITEFSQILRRKIFPHLFKIYLNFFVCLSNLINCNFLQLQQEVSACAWRRNGRDRQKCFSFASCLLTCVFSMSLSLFQKLSLDLYYTEDEIYELSYTREPKNCKAAVSHQHRLLN